jgi:hypothetical protein
MFQTFFKTESGNIYIFKTVQTETVRRISSKYIVKELSALFNFKIIASIKRSFINISSNFSLKYKIKYTYLVFPSPLLTNKSKAKTSLTWNSWSSTFCSNVYLLIITLFPSIKCFLRSWERTPSNGLTW